MSIPYFTGVILSKICFQKYEVWEKDVNGVLFIERRSKPSADYDIIVIILGKYADMVG